jgi:hypothetical protein
MSTCIEVPKCIKERLIELNDLVERNPFKIPLNEAAEFLDMNAEGLRVALINGTAPFGFGYRKDKDGYRTLVIPTVPFYLWYTGTPASAVPNI